MNLKIAKQEPELQVELLLNSHEANLDYEITLYLTKTHNDKYSVSKLDGNACRFHSLDEIEHVLRFFANGDFAYAFVRNASSDQVATYYIRNDVSQLGHARLHCVNKQ